MVISKTKAEWIWEKVEIYIVFRPRWKTVDIDSAAEVPTETDG